ncbi:MAG: DNA-3-methyladenine glycosylase I [Thermoplasmata archaeon]
MMIEYHDNEWGVPEHDDKKLFQFLVLGGAQAGLSWMTILRRREGYLKAFEGFDPRVVAKYDDKKIEELLKDKGIIRNRSKVSCAVANASALVEVQKEFGSFDEYIWKFVGSRPKKNNWRTDKDIPARTDESDAMSEDLKNRGFKYVGSTICYAFMQAAGMVNDHVVDCFRYEEVDSG